jgi:hypothetical protein
MLIKIYPLVNILVRISKGCQFIPKTLRAKKFTHRVRPSYKTSIKWCKKESNQELVKIPSLRPYRIAQRIQ